MEEGKIIEAGTHQQLISRKGAYAELFTRQQLSEKRE
jgi:ABC-type multidrug transport system fused ATPase/permease subunit